MEMEGRKRSKKEKKIQYNKDKQYNTTKTLQYQKTIQYKARGWGSLLCSLPVAHAQSLADLWLVEVLLLRSLEVQLMLELNPVTNPLGRGGPGFGRAWPGAEVRALLRCWRGGAAMQPSCRGRKGPWGLCRSALCHALKIL